MAWDGSGRTECHFAVTIGNMIEEIHQLKSSVEELKKQIEVINKELTKEVTNERNIKISKK